MKYLKILPALLAALSLATPVSALAKDRDHRDRDDHRHHDRNDHHYSSRPSYYSSHHRPYLYGSSYGRSPYYYGGPTIGFSYYHSSSPRTVYRGRPAYESYSDGLAADVQRELRRRGYYRGSIDGDIGPGSRSAIRQYQADRGLERDWSRGFQLVAFARSRVTRPVDFTQAARIVAALCFGH